MKPFYDYLESIEIYEASDVKKTIAKLEIQKIFKVAKMCYELSEITGFDLYKDSIFNFSASTAMSGGISPCAEIECRIKNVYQLAVFAALYAEKVLIPNYFEYMHEFSGDFKNEDQFYFFINRLLGDIIMMIYLKPLILEGIICINPAIRAYCNDCFKVKLLQEKKLEKAFKNLEKKLDNKVVEKVEFVLDTSKTLIINAEKDYVNAEVIRFGILPTQLKKYTKNMPHAFTKAEAKKEKFSELILNPIFNDLVLQKYSMINYDTVYLTNQKLETEIINAFDNTTTATDLQKPIIEGLVHELPFVHNADIGKLVELRKREKTAFMVYRDAVKKTIRDVQGLDDVSKIKEIVQMNVIPEVNKIENIIKIHKDDYKNKLKGEILFDGMILTAGLFANKFFGVDISATIQATGGLIGAKDIFKNVLPLTTAPAEAKRNEYYFLWKLKHE